MIEGKTIFIKLSEDGRVEIQTTDMSFIEELGLLELAKAQIIDNHKLVRE